MSSPELQPHKALFFFVKVCFSTGFPIFILLIIYSALITNTLLGVFSETESCEKTEWLFKKHEEDTHFWNIFKKLSFTNVFLPSPCASNMLHHSKSSNAQFSAVPYVITEGHMGDLTMAYNKYGHIIRSCMHEIGNNSFYSILSKILINPLHFKTCQEV